MQNLTDFCQQLMACMEGVWGGGEWKQGFFKICFVCHSDRHMNSQRDIRTDRHIDVQHETIIPHHDSGGVLWFHVGHLCVCPTVCPSIHPSVHFLFPDDNLSKYQGFSRNLECHLIIAEIWFGIANGQIS